MKDFDHLLELLKRRFEKNVHRHSEKSWSDVLERLHAAPVSQLLALKNMEQSGGEPDVVDLRAMPSDLVFIDCSAESPKGRRSLCYDPDALAARKEHKPKGSALGQAATMGVDLLTEEQYRQLQEVDTFDLKTSSWIKTPDEVRSLGGALFCDRRYDKVFLYHNGAQSYYAARGFRAILSIP